MPTPLPVIPGVYYCYVRANYLSLPTGNTFAFRTIAAGGSLRDVPSDAAVIASALVTNWNASMISRYPVGTTGTDSRVYALGHATLPPSLAHATATGSGSGGVAPVSCAAVIKHQVMRRGRGSQSHTSISPLLAGDIEAGGESLTSGHDVSITTAFNAFIDGTISEYGGVVSGALLQYVQLSKKLGQVFDILSSTCETLLGTERSRTPRP